MLRIANEEFSSLCKQWKKALIIKHLEGNLSYMGLSTRISKAWQLKGEMVKTDVDNDFYVVRFIHEVDYDTMLFGALGL